MASTGFLATGTGFLAGAFDFSGAEVFFATGLAIAGLLNFAGGLFAGFEWDLATGFEGFATFFAALDLAAGRDGLFEEVVFVFNLLSVRPGERAVEHPPRVSLGQEFVFEIFAFRLWRATHRRFDSSGRRFPV